LVLRLKRVQNCWQRAVELHINDGSGYLPDAANSSITHLSLPQTLSEFHKITCRFCLPRALTVHRLPCNRAVGSFIGNATGFTACIADEGRR